MKIKQLSIFMENAPGTLTKVTGIFSEHGISIRTFHLADTEGFGIMRVIVDKPEEAYVILKDKGITAILSDAVMLTINDSPGSFNKILSRLLEAGLSVEYAYAYTIRDNDEALVVVKTSDDDRAVELIG